LLAKWLVRYKDPLARGYWKSILQYKYNTMNNRASFSSFWKDVTLNLDVVDFYLNKKVRNGITTRFWLDR
jgi:hypothetical protein